MEISPKAGEIPTFPPPRLLLLVYILGKITATAKSNPGPKSVNHVPGLKCQLCPRLFIGGDISADLKQAALFFDKIAIRHVHQVSEDAVFSGTQEGQRALESMTWLKEHDLTIRWPDEIMPTDDFPSQVPAQVIDRNPKLFSDLERAYSKHLVSAVRFALADQETRNPDPERDANGYQYKDLVVRSAALYLNVIQGQDATPIIDLPTAELAYVEGSPADVMKLILRHMPAPDKDTPWEAIQDFRADVDARRQLNRLRHWIRERVGKGVQLQDMAEELTELVGEYQEYMELQHRKIRLGTLETIVVGTAAILQSLPRFEFSDLAKKLFELKNWPMQLLEAEQKAPGREVAYLSELGRRFGG